jgi:hypothetical protein
MSAVGHPVVIVVSALHFTALGKCALTLGILTIHSPGLSSHKTSGILSDGKVLNRQSILVGQLMELVFVCIRISVSNSNT